MNSRDIITSILEKVKKQRKKLEFRQMFVHFYLGGNFRVFSAFDHFNKILCPKWLSAKVIVYKSFKIDHLQ